MTKYIIRTNGGHDAADHVALLSQGWTCLRSVEHPLFNFFGHVVDMSVTASLDDETKRLQTVLPNVISIDPVVPYSIPPSPKGRSIK